MATARIIHFAFIAHCVSTFEVVPDLKLLVVVSRHGYRAPANTYKNDPFGPNIWPAGLSSLTIKGVKQQYALGQYFGKRYRGLGDPEKAVRQVYVTSTNYDRTLQSAQANMAGWFPPSKSDVWADDRPLAELWRPFPVRFPEDPSLLLKTSCQLLDQYNEQQMKLLDFLDKKHKVFLDYVRRHSGESNLTIARGLEEVSEVLRTQKYAGFQYPPWVNETVYNQIQYLDSLRFHIWVGGNGDVTTARITGGKLLDHILVNFQNKTRGIGDVKNRKVLAYFVHHSSIGALLSVLDLFDYSFDEPVEDIPTYASTMLFELHWNDTVRILFKNDTNQARFDGSDPKVLKHPNCETYCPLSKLVQFTAEYRPTVASWQLECDGESKSIFPVKRALKLVGRTGVGSQCLDGISVCL